MSDRLVGDSNSETLRGPEGQLVFVRLYAAPRILEDVLELLARASFPVNPEIRHSSPLTVVEFPAYDAQVAEVRELLRAAGLDAVEVHVENALTAMH